jgi:hypothetical protein
VLDVLTGTRYDAETDTQNGPEVLHRAVTDGTDIATARDVLTREMQAHLDQIVAADAAA